MEYYLTQYGLDYLQGLYTQNKQVVLHCFKDCQGLEKATEVTAVQLHLKHDEILETRELMSGEFAGKLYRFCNLCISRKYTGLMTADRVEIERQKRIERMAYQSLGLNVPDHLL